MRSKEMIELRLKELSKELKHYNSLQKTKAYDSREYKTISTLLDFLAGAVSTLEWALDKDYSEKDHIFELYSDKIDVEITGG